MILAENNDATPLRGSNWGLYDNANYSILKLIQDHTYQLILLYNETKFGW